MPFFEYNNLSGRLVPSTRLQPMYPIRPIPLNKAEAPPVMFDTIKTKVMKTSTATAATSTSSKSGSTWDQIIMKGQETLPENMKRNYIQFQTNMHEPVFLKGGLKDRILFGLTVAGLAYVGATTIYKMYKYSHVK